MSVVAAAPRTFFRTIRKSLRASLRNYLPGFLIAHKSDFSQALLSKDEILDLQLRVTSKNRQPIHSHDTAEQRMGDRQSIYRGYGLDYEESRPYQAGDEPRYINWKLTARTGELYMKVFREERRPGVVILLDRRKTMQFGTRTRLKVTQAARVATCIAFSAQQRHAAISAVVLEATQHNLILIKDANDSQAVANLIQAACAPCPPIISPHANSYQATNNECDFDYALSILQETHIPGSTLYLIGDFMDFGEQHRSKLIQLSAHNDVHAIHIVDPAEKDFPRAGTLRFHAVNDEQDVTINTMDSTISKTYKDAAMEHFSAIKQLFNALNVTYTEISTDCDAIETELAVK